MVNNRIEKLIIYDNPVKWLKFYMFFVVYFLLLLKFLLLINFLQDKSHWNGMIGGQYFENGYVIVHILMIASLVATGAMMPLLNKWSYILNVIQLSLMIVLYPFAAIICKVQTGSFPSRFYDWGLFIYIVEALFAIINLYYFYERKDLFYKDIFDLSAGVRAKRKK